MKALPFLIISVLIFVFFSCNNHISSNSKLVQIDNNKFEFELPKDSKEFEGELKNSLIEMNSNILYLALCGTKNSRYWFSVSKYISEYKTSIEEAFIESVLTTTNLDVNDTLKDNYRLVDFKIYHIKEKTLRYKISEHFDKVYTLMYYFMKDDYSNELYEIKATADTNNLPEVLKFLEKVALSVKIK